MMRRATLLAALAAGLLAPSAHAAITVNDAQVTEGGKVAFTVTNDSSLPASAQFATTDGSAKAGSDYETKSQNVSFLGSGDQIVEVQTTTDTDPETDETFTVTVTPPGGDPDTGTGTIKNDDAPSIAIRDVSVSESAGSATVQLASQAVGNDVTVAFATSDDTATSADYTPSSGRATIRAGQGSGTITVPLTNDTVDEEDERFKVKLSSPEGASVSDDDATVTITNDDGRLVSVGDIGVVEGDGEQTIARFPVQLSGPTFRTVTLQFATVDGPARAPSDYLSRVGTVTFVPGQTQQLIDVAIAADELPEGNEFFGVIIGQAAGASILRNAAVAAIRDDDAGETGGNDRQSPRMRLTKPRLSGGRSIRARVTCPRGERRCRGRLVVYARIGRRERRIGAKTFSLPGNAARTLRINIPRSILRTARRRGRLPIRAYMVTRDAAENVDTAERAATLRFRR
jgi:hypothetical protein